ncbi:SUMO-specific isopeptidase USPL1, partial [Galemys pyrenaicus]
MTSCTEAEHVQQNYDSTTIPPNRQCPAYRNIYTAFILWILNSPLLANSKKPKNHIDIDDEQVLNGKHNGETCKISSSLPDLLYSDQLNSTGTADFLNQNEILEPDAVNMAEEDPSRVDVSGTRGTFPKGSVHILTGHAIREHTVLPEVKCPMEKCLWCLLVGLYSVSTGALGRVATSAEMQVRLRQLIQYQANNHLIERSLDADGGWMEHDDLKGPCEEKLATSTLPVMKTKYLQHSVLWVTLPRHSQELAPQMSVASQTFSQDETLARGDCVLSAPRVSALGKEKFSPEAARISVLHLTCKNKHTIRISSQTAEATVVANPADSSHATDPARVAKSVDIEGATALENREGHFIKTISFTEVGEIKTKTTCNNINFEEKRNCGNLSPKSDPSLKTNKKLDQKLMKQTLCFSSEEKSLICSLQVRGRVAFKIKVSTKRLARNQQSVWYT